MLVNGKTIINYENDYYIILQDDVRVTIIDKYDMETKSYSLGDNNLEGIMLDIINEVNDDEIYHDQNFKDYIEGID